MAHERLSLQPTLRQLLRSEALSEAQIVVGDEYLDSHVTQVVSGLSIGSRAGSLVVIRPEAVQFDPAALKDIAGLIVIRPVSSAMAAAAARTARTPISTEVDVEHLTRICVEARTALILLPGLGEPVEIASDIRQAYLSEVKRASAHIHARFVRTVIEDGIEGLVELVSELIDRPVALETADFKLLGAAQNISPTPQNQRKMIIEEIAEDLNRELRAAENGFEPEVEAVKMGRRLVLPVVLEGTVVGYYSVMVRQNDDAGLLTEYLRPAATAALVEFIHSRKGVSNSASNRGLLKDLLSGYVLPSSDQESLEQFFGFDMCDGMVVLAVSTIPEQAARTISWIGDRRAFVEMEGTLVFILAYDSKQEKTWQQAAEELAAEVKQNTGATHVQIGAGRISETLLDLGDGYRDARQALVTGQMIHGANDFMVSYADLGIKRLLYLIIDHPELDSFYEEHLKPLEAYDEEWETDLVPTLRVYLQQGANLNSAAKELFVHRHTMRYRLEQIAELLKVDIDNTEVLLNLQIAFQIKDMKGKSQS